MIWCSAIPASDYKYYTTGIGRLWPVRGTYSNVQRELYGFIVAYHKVLLELIRPSALAEEICREAGERMKEVIGRTRSSKPIYEASACRALEQMHLNHPVGIAVHDVGHYRDDPLVPGLLIIVDPMMWIPEELKYIRVEDTLLITESGFENVTVDAPLELDDVEARMKEVGMVQRYPAV